MKFIAKKTLGLNTQAFFSTNYSVILYIILCVYLMFL